MTHRIDTVEARAKLKARPTPYWQRLRAGLALGWRKPAAGSAGAWIAQVYNGGPGKQTRKTLGDFADLPQHQRYDAARRAAEALAAHLAGGGQADTMTVAEVCAAYVEHLRAEGREATADDAEARFRRRVLGSRLAKLDVRKLTAHHLRTWRQGLRARPVVANPHAGADQQRTRERAPSSLNRDMTALRAALNFAVTGGIATTDAAWRVELRPLKGATRRRDLYLDPGQRRALLAHASDDVVPLLRALCVLPLRPGALAALTVGDFDRRLGTLKVGSDKAGAGRVITLPEQTAAFLAECSRDKLPSAPLFARADGTAWGRHDWKKRVAAAAAAAGLPDGTSAYTLRHSVITDLIGGGGDTLTVARLAATSLPMIERHYGHLRASHGAAALARLAAL